MSEGSCYSFFDHHTILQQWRDSGALAVRTTCMLRVRLFSSNLALCLYELNLFFWLSTAYHLIVCGAELNQQTLRQNTSELPDKKAQLQTCCVFCLPWEERRVEDDEEVGWMEGGEEQICLIVLKEADAHPE